MHTHAVPNKPQVECFAVFKWIILYCNKYFTDPVVSDPCLRLNIIEYYLYITHCIIYIYIFIYIYLYIYIFIYIYLYIYIYIYIYLYIYKLCEGNTHIYIYTHSSVIYIKYYIYTYMWAKHICIPTGISYVYISIF